MVIDNDSKGYTVGYGKPPTQNQFRPGQSGNPAGRRRGVRNLQTDVKRTLKVPVAIKEDGHSRKISTQEGVLLRLREKALHGDARALDRFIDLAIRFNNDAGETGAAQPLSADDEAILAAYRDKIAAAAKTAETSKSSDDASPAPDPKQEDPK